MEQLMRDYGWALLLAIGLALAQIWWLKWGRVRTLPPSAGQIASEPASMASARDISTKAAVPTSAPVEAPPAEPTQTSSAAQDALGERPNIAPAVGAPDNLRLIKGIGPKLETLCADLGVCRFDQIAAWEEADITEVDRHLIGFHGRIIRDKWVDQAGFLARNDMAGYEARFGKVDRSTA